MTMDNKPDSGLRLNLSYPMYEDHSISRGGRLPDFERGAHACWYYCTCAHLHLNSIDEGAVYDGELDILPALNNIARSVAILYQLDDPDSFLVYMPVVIDEATRVGMGWDPRVLNPGKESFKFVI